MSAQSGLQCCTGVGADWNGSFANADAEPGPTVLGKGNAPKSGFTEQVAGGGGRVVGFGVWFGLLFNDLLVFIYAL